VRNDYREAERILRELGLRIIETGHSKHRWWLVETADGRRFKHGIPQDMGSQRHWLNWRAQVRQRMHR
jgi:hypothetical protein